MQCADLRQLYIFVCLWHAYCVIRKYMQILGIIIHLHCSVLLCFEGNVQDTVYYTYMYQLIKPDAEPGGTVSESWTTAMCGWECTKFHGFTPELTWVSVKLKFTRNDSETVCPLTVLLQKEETFCGAVGCSWQRRTGPGLLCQHEACLRTFFRLLRWYSCFVCPFLPVTLPQTVLSAASLCTVL